MTEVVEQRWGRAIERVYRGYQAHLRRTPPSVQEKPVPPSLDEILLLLDELFTWLDEARRANENPVLIAGIFHLRFESIHPFGDGNGPIRRLAMNHILLESGYPPPV